jgi:ribose transport system substrate-binding protein
MVGSMRHACAAIVLALSLTVPAATARAERIGVILPGHILGFWCSLRKGMEQAARDLNIQLIVRGAADGAALDRQVNVQLRLMDYMIAQGVSGLVLAPEPLAAGTPPVSVKVPLVLVDREGPAFKSLSIVATDNFAAGRKAALSLAGVLPTGANVAVLRLAANIPSTTQREDGFVSVAREKGWNVVIDAHVGYELREAEERAAALLHGHQGALDAVFAPNETVAFGAVRVIGAMPPRARPRLVVFDWRPEFRQALADGVLHAVVLQDVHRMGYRSVTTAAAAVRGETVASKQDVDIAIVTRLNMDDPAILPRQADCAN